MYSIHLSKSWGGSGDSTSHPHTLFNISVTVAFLMLILAYDMQFIKDSGPVSIRCSKYIYRY